MKNKFKLLGVLFLASLALVSCNKKEDSLPLANGEKFILNYGDYSGGKSTITLIDKTTDEALTDYYKTANGVSMTSNVQYAYNYNNNIYMMGNNVDEISWINSGTLMQTSNAISSSEIVKPRFCIASGGILYVSCWNGEPWNDADLGQITKIDLATNQVVGKIDIPGGPEGLAVSNGKLYVALGYKMKIGVIDLETEAVSYITTPAISGYFQKDSEGNLYVSLVSSYSMPSFETGLGYINTKTDELETVYSLSSISSNYSSTFSPNSDFSKIYVLAGGWVEETPGNWVQKGAVQVFDVASKSFEPMAFVDGVDGLNAVEFDVKTGDVMLMNTSGVISVYDTGSKLVKEYNAGSDPAWLIEM